MSLSKFPNPVPIVLACGLLMAVVFRDYSAHNIGFTEDMGLSMAVASAVRDGQTVLLGPPSHTGGRHLGAIGYWYVVIAQWLANGAALSTFFWITVMELVGVFLMAALAFSASSGRGRTWGAVGVLIGACSIQYVEILRYPWHNHFLLLPASIFLMCAYRALGDLRRWAGALALSASLTVQLHYSSLPLIAAVVGCVAVKRLLSAGSVSKVIKEAFDLHLGNWSLYAFTALSWLPLLIYELRYPGNLARVFLPHVDGIQAAAGYGAAGRLLLDLFRFPVFGHIPAREMGTAAVFLASAFSLLAVWMLLRVLQRGSAALRWLLAGLGAAICLFVLSLGRLPAPLYHSYTFSLLPVPLLLFGLVLGAALNDIAVAKLSRRVPAALLVILSIYFLGRQFVPAAAAGRETYRYHSLAHVQGLSRAIEADSSGEPLHLVTAASSKAIKGALLFALGPRHFHQILYWDWLHELPQLDAAQPPPSIAYLVSCPRPLSNYRRELDARMEIEWEREYALDLSSCTDCEGCVVNRYKRRNLG